MSVEDLKCQGYGHRRSVENPLPEEVLSPFSQPVVLRVKRVDPRAVLPTRANEFDAGYDLSSLEEVTLMPGERRLVSTGLCMEIPIGHYGRVAPRSGLAVKHGLHVGAGVIDSPYRGLCQVLLFNLGTEAVTLPRGRIAQLILEKISTPPVTEVAELSATVRGAGGFGSTGH